MDKKPNWWQRRKIGMSQGAPIAPWRMLNDGNPVQSLIIRYKDIYLDVTLDAESGEPTGDFGWSHSPHMFPDVNINDFWQATPPVNTAAITGLEANPEAQENATEAPNV